MGYLEIRKLNADDKLDTCDQCQQQGLVASGEFIEQDGLALMWICFNCVHKNKRSRR